MCIFIIKGQTLKHAAVCFQLKVHIVLVTISKLTAKFKKIKQRKKNTVLCLLQNDQSFSKPLRTNTKRLDGQEYKALQTWTGQRTGNPRALTVQSWICASHFRFTCWLQSICGRISTLSDMHLDHETLRTLSRFRDLSCHQGTVRYIPSTFTIKGLSHFSASDVLLHFFFFNRSFQGSKSGQMKGIHHRHSVVTPFNHPRWVAVVRSSPHHRANPMSFQSTSNRPFW